MSELSGLELRKAVAKLIGWTEVHNMYLNVPPSEEYDLWGHTPDHDPAVKGGWTVVPHYELSIDACFKDVVPWANERGYAFCLRKGPSWAFMNRTDIAAEAICRAALKLEEKDV